MLLSFVFFFQAEDGIRDIGVTGVQTCALPIFEAMACGVPVLATTGTPHAIASSAASPNDSVRTEERRVGKYWQIGKRAVIIKNISTRYRCIQRINATYDIDKSDTTVRQ